MSSNDHEQSKYLLHPQNHSSSVTYGLHTTVVDGKGEDSESSEISSDEDDEVARANLLRRSENFSLSYDVQKGYRGTELKLSSFQRPHMRAFHGSWMCFFASFFTMFSISPLLPIVQQSLKLSRQELWRGNLAMMVGGIPTRVLLGPFVEKYGGKGAMTGILGLSGIVCGFSALVYDARSLSFARFLIGALDTFVPCQFWITCLFVREVAATAMAIAGGLGSVGSALAQIVLGSGTFPLLSMLLQGDHDLAWRLSLLVPALFSITTAFFFAKYSDDCPLGDIRDCKKAGLIVERSAVDSFRSGAMNINSWLLFLQFAFSCGVDFTMSNGAAVYFHKQFGEPVATVGVIAFLYGISALYARAVGGYLSDMMDVCMSLRGRLLVHFLCMVLQGLLNVWFARMETLASSIWMMVIFSIFVQMSMGTCFGIVPYVDGPNVGSVAGIVAAGGNVGGALCSILFMSFDYGWAMESMGWLTVISSFLTFFIVIKGYKGLVFGIDDKDYIARSQQSPLVVPGKMQHSPHLVAYKRRMKRQRDKRRRENC